VEVLNEVFNLQGQHLLVKSSRSWPQWNRPPQQLVAGQPQLAQRLEIARQPLAYQIPGAL
jgi:hypothetical protein